MSTQPPSTRLNEESSIPTSRRFNRRRQTGSSHAGQVRPGPSAFPHRAIRSRGTPRASWTRKRNAMKGVSPIR
jgi:hypothetical protein